MTSAVCMTAEAAKAEFSYAGSQSVEQWGTDKSFEVYDIAIQLDNPMFVGKKITGMSVALPYSPYITEASGWLSTELKLSGKDNVANVVTVSGESQNGKLRITFPEPYTITEDGVYVGYTVKVGGTAIEASAKPIAVVSGKQPGSFYVHSSRVWLSWSDLSEKLDLCSAITVDLDGDFVTNAVGVTSLPDIMADPDAEVIIPVGLRNDGLGSIASIEYEVEIGGKKSVFSRLFYEPIMSRLFELATVELPIGIINSVGRTKYNLTITKVNGQPNNSVSASASGNVDVVAYRPVNRPLLEDYTAFTCGYCPRGMAALERMYSLYPDDFIGVSYHSGDAISITTIFPNPADALPTAWMNRSVECDPYFGLTSGTFGIENYWNELRKEEVPVGIDMKVYWEDVEHTKLKVNSEVVFIRPVDQQYSLTYLLVSSGLHSEKWSQSNYYSGASSDGWIEEMKPYFSAAKMMRDVVYDDIVAMSAPMKGIEGSLPASPEPYEINRHSYIFNIDEAYSRDRVNMVPDKDKLKVVCTVLDAEGKAVNSFMAKPDLSGVDSPTADNAKVVETEVYDLSGRRMNAMPESGVYIVREKLDNGRTRTHKIIL